MIREIRLEMVKIGFVLYARTVIVLYARIITHFIGLSEKKKKKGESIKMDLSSFPPLLIEWFVLTIGIDEGIYSCASLNVHQAWIVRNQLRREMYFNEISKISPFLFFFFLIGTRCTIYSKYSYSVLK